MDWDGASQVYFWGKCVRTQVPLALAWAMTVHKAQGASLDLVVVDLQGAFAPGQVIVQRTSKPCRRSFFGAFLTMRP